MAPAATPVAHARAPRPEGRPPAARTGPEPLAVQAVTSLDGMAELRAEWEALRQGTASAGNIFATWEWMHAWARHYLAPGQLWVLTVRSPEEGLIGVAPFYRRRARLDRLVPLREVRFLGTEEVCSSHLDVIAAERDKRRVLHRLYQHVHEEAAGGWDVLTLSEIPAESSTIDLWSQLADEAGKVLECVRLTVCPVIALTGRLDDFLAGISAKERHHLRRKQRAFAEAGGAAAERVAAADELPGALEAMAALHQMRWTQRGLGGAFQSPRFLAFHREFLRTAGPQGRVRVDFFRFNGEAIASAYGFSYAGRYSYYLPGLNPGVMSSASPGILLLYHCLQQALGEGCREVDLLQGWADYKWSWATTLRRSVTLRHYNRRPRAGLAKLLAGARDAIKVLVR